MSKKSPKTKTSLLADIFYAVRTISKCSPMLITSYILMQTAQWFFVGFIQKILFLRLLLQLIENGGSFESFAKLVIIFSCAGLLAKATDYVMDYFVNTRVKLFYKNMNDLIFRKAVKVDISCYENPEFYNIYKRSTEIVANNHFLEFSYNLGNILANVITGAFLVVYVVSIDYKLLLILLFTVVVLIAGAAKGKAEVIRDKEMTVHKRSKDYVKRTVFLKDFAKDIRTSGIYEVMHNRFKNAVDKNREILKEYGIKMMLLEMVGGFFGKALPVVVAYSYATFRFVVKKNLAIADFSVIVTAVSNLKDVLNNVNDSVAKLCREAEYFANLKEFMDFEPTVIGGSKIAEEFESIEFRNVHFTYPGAKRPSLNGLSLKITKNETVAVVGKNGAGKTTFVKLLLCFYNPDEGTILYNGTDIREYDIPSLRKKLATVFQDYKVFALTVNENVLCRETENADDAETVDAALKAAGIYERILALPEQKETVFTREFDEKGTGLSGGEQQKLCTARMFAKDFDFALLDEPSSALDPIAEYKMYESLIEATKNKTVIYISHRLSSAVLSDKIYVFDGGKVSECGTHEQLMADGKGYCEMFNLQASSYRNAEGGDE